ncbi:hypothetical protein SLE2022_070540 [Rubroshorea leprosula]
MVFKKRLSYEFNGLHVPNVPRAPRSSRRRVLHKRTVEDGQICAIELLASLADKLLQESESFASSNASEGNNHSRFGKNVVKQERRYEDKPLKIESLDQGSCELSVFGSELIPESNGDLKEFQNAENHATLECIPVMKKSSCSDKVASDLKTVIGGTAKIDGAFSNVGDSCDCKSENKGFEEEGQPKGLDARTLTMSNTCISKDSMEICMTFPESINSDRDVKLTPHRDFVRKASFSRLRNAIKLGSRDDDDKNFTRSNKFSNRFKASRPPTRIGDRRIRRLLTSKYWKVAPKLKDFEVSKADRGLKPLYCKRKACYNNGKYQYDIFYKKKKKFCDWHSTVTSDGGVSSESVSNSPEKIMSGDKSNSAAMLHGANGVSSSFIGQQASHRSMDSHVKLSIESFRIPELFIEVPETATVGSLKRTIMEAVTALLGGGLRVGVLLQGKKVRDDSRTLSQSGISCKDNLGTLGFTLEPSTIQSPAPVCSVDSPLPLSHDAAENGTRSLATPPVDSGISEAVPEPPSLTNPENPTDGNQEPVSSHTDILTDPDLPESKALVPVPAMNAEALVVVPLNQKPKKSELAQRRTRRPFSVTEVEALVQAVEEVGTGRWRDVKLRAFENAEHRTYVDLKDKWKTLVHTARISPQQRRGEPVPQELLDRVLAAHAYWSQHQAKQEGKHQSGTLKLTETSDRNGAGAIQLLM